MKEFWEAYLHVCKVTAKWTLLVYGALSYFSWWFDLGYNGWDIGKAGTDTLRRWLPKCLYERLGVEEGEEA